jgi:hypothetical protein
LKESIRTMCLGSIIKHLLELVHNDLSCINLPSLVDARYILTFIDDLSRFTWVFFVKNKNRVFERFKEFWAFAEKKSGRPIKCLISENVGEYVNRPFKEYLLDLVLISNGRFLTHLSRMELQNIRIRS